MAEPKVNPLPEYCLEALPLFPEVLLFEWPYRHLNIMATTEKQKDGTFHRKVQIHHTNNVAPTWFEVLDIRRRFFRPESRVFTEIPPVRHPMRVRIDTISLLESVLVKEEPIEADRPSEAATGVPLQKEKVRE